MKKIFLTIGFIATAALITNAQIGSGGFPLSTLNNEYSANLYIPVSEFPLPEWDNFLAEYDNNESNPFQMKPYLVSRMVESDISFPESGVFYESENGTIIWKAQVKVADAKGIGFYYDKFNLPRGVNYFISNENGRHVLGAFTNENNAESGVFANEAVQGGVINLELNIQPWVNQEDIVIHINQVAVYFRAVEYLSAYETKEEIRFIYDQSLFGGSSRCQINAACSQSADYLNQRRASLQQIINQGNHGGLCSGTMVNVVGNTPSNCKKYYLTAAHCERSNTTDPNDIGLQQILLRFNYETNSCISLTAPTSRTITGAKLVARSHISGQSQTIVGDFMLMEVTQNIPPNWNVNLSGWDNSHSPRMIYQPPKKFIGFHHPAGDVKKQSSSQSITSSGVAKNNTHWQQALTEGLIEGGSSGSGLFNGDGRLIGIASVANYSGASQQCRVNIHGDSVTPSTVVWYAKFSTSWDYSEDGNNNNRKLKPWLDPNNTGATVLHTVNSACSDVEGRGGVSVNNVNLENAILIHPNPVVNQQLNLQFNLKDFSDLNLTMFDITGKEVKSAFIENVVNGTYALDVSSLISGMYMVKITDGNATMSKKVMIKN